MRNEYYGIKTPDKGEDGKPYIWWIGQSPYEAWSNFFMFPDKSGDYNFYRTPLAESEKAYKAIGYKCVKICIEEIGSVEDD